MDYNQMIISDLKTCHQAALDGGWWTDIKTGESMVGKRDYIQLCGLIMTETSEAFEGGAEPDDKLPHRCAFEVELADTMIRCADTSIGCGLDLTANFEYLENASDVEEAVIKFLPVSCEVYNTYHRALAVSLINLQISKSIEGFRKRDIEKQKYHMAMAISAIICISVEFGMNVRLAMVEKLVYNSQREDHKIENRRKEGGKKE